MRNPLTTQTVTDELGRLLTAFPRRGTQNLAQLTAIYKTGLVGVETDALRSAVVRCIQEDEFFPKVARLRELADLWMRHNRATIAPTLPDQWDICPVCDARAMTRMVTRPILTKPTSDPKTWYYALTDGRTVAVGDVAALAAAGPLVPLETVESRGLTMHHRPGPHHVRDDESGRA